MRKRAAVEETTPAAEVPTTPAREGQNTLEFITCKDCDLQQSRGTVERNGGKCKRCESELLVLSEPVEERRDKAPVTPPKVEAPKPVPEQPKLPHTEPAASVPAQFHPKAEPGYTGPTCKTCGARLTETALMGWTCGNGHNADVDQKTQGGKWPGKTTTGALPNPDTKYVVAGAPTMKVQRWTDEPIDDVTVTWGEEVYSPVQYNSFRLGPYSMTTAVRPGETRAQAFERAYDDLERLAAASFAKKREAFFKNLGTLKHKS
jgi:hypothetical protein